MMADNAKSTLLERVLNATVGWGFEIKRKSGDKVGETGKSFAPPLATDGSQIITTVGGRGAMFTSHLDFGVEFVDEHAMIDKYREVSQGQEVSDAIDQIANESVVNDNSDYSVSLVLDDIPDSKVNKKVKKLINEEFINLLDLMSFRRSGWDIFRKWYVDGRLAYHKIIDETNSSKGITELRYIDPRKIAKIRQLKPSTDPKQLSAGASQGATMLGTATRIYDSYEEFFIYNEEGIQRTPGQVPAGLRIKSDTILFATSGIVDPRTGVVQSYLQKALKPYNQLRMLEDATVVYRLARAPERRIFYVDTAGMQTTVAEAYMDKIIAALKQEIRYDINTGEVINQRKFMTMLEDYFLPQRDSGGTKIENLPGGENLGEMEDVKYFLTKLYRALSIPPSRITQQDNPFSSGRPDTISRDELNFSRFISRLRSKFATEVFDDLLRTQLSLKKILNVDEWEAIREKIRYDFRTDVHVAEFMESELIDLRLSKLSEAMTAIDNGFISRRWVRTHILRQTEDDIRQIDKEIEEEKKELEENPPPGRDNPTVGGPGDMAGGMMGGEMGPDGELVGQPGMPGAMPPQEQEESTSRWKPKSQQLWGGIRSDYDDVVTGQRWADG